MGKPRDKKYKEKNKGRSKADDLKNKHTEWSENEFGGKLEKLNLSEAENGDTGKVIKFKFKIKFKYCVKSLGSNSGDSSEDSGEASLEVNFPVAMWDVAQCDPKKCSGRKLERFSMVMS